MTIAKRRTDFCRRMQALSRVRHVQAARQGVFQAGQTEQEWPVVPLQGVREQAVQTVSEVEARSPLECPEVPAPAVQGS